MNTSIIKKKIGHLVRVGGAQHSGWLPDHAPTPLPTPIRDVLFDIEIQFDGSGYLLCYVSQDGSLYGDTWHETLAYAQEAAAEDFGLSDADWDVE